MTTKKKNAFQSFKTAVLRFRIKMQEKMFIKSEKLNWFTKKIIHYGNKRRKLLNL